MCVSHYFDAHGTKKKLPIGVLDTVQTLHDCLDQLEDAAWGPECVAAHAAVASLCETWWLRDGPARERVIVQALPPLVEAVLRGAAPRPALRRLHGLRAAFAVVDFDDAASDNFAALLLRLASSPHCLKVPEGQRLLGSLLALATPTAPAASSSSSLRTQLHRSMRAQIPDNKASSILQALGEIYFCAWKEADADTRTAIEQEVLSDLVYAAIHAANGGLVENLLVVLEKFHDAKRNAAGQALLQRLYGPILWRSLSSAHARVRAQAARVLQAVFPLSTTTEKNPVTKGVAALKQLLQDRDARVRAAGSQAVAAILTTYWDVVPARDIRVLLNRKWFVSSLCADSVRKTLFVGS